MSHQPQKILVAPAWPYASGPRHIGHVAGFAVPADVFARYHRLKGNDVLMVSGTDEHGTPVMVSADRNGVSPRELADRNNALIREFSNQSKVTLVGSAHLAKFAEAELHGMPVADDLIVQEISKADALRVERFRVERGLGEAGQRVGLEIDRPLRRDDEIGS